MKRPPGTRSDHSNGRILPEGQGPPPEVWEDFNASNVNVTKKIIKPKVKGPPVAPPVKGPPVAPVGPPVAPQGSVQASVQMLNMPLSAQQASNHWTRAAPYPPPAKAPALANHRGELIPRGPYPPTDDWSAPEAAVIEGAHTQLITPRSHSSGERPIPPKQRSVALSLLGSRPVYCFKHSN